MTGRAGYVREEGFEELVGKMPERYEISTAVHTGNRNRNGEK